MVTLLLVFAIAAFVAMALLRSVNRPTIEKAPSSLIYTANNLATEGADAK